MTGGLGSPANARRFRLEAQRQGRSVAKAQDDVGLDAEALIRDELRDVDAAARFPDGAAHGVSLSRKHGLARPIVEDGTHEAVAGRDLHAPADLAEEGDRFDPEAAPRQPALVSAMTPILVVFP